VLLADDFLPLQRALKRLLEPDCEVVGQATTVAELLEEANTRRPDVVVVDLHLPGPDGLHACRQLRSAQPDVGIIMLTAMDDPDMQRAALEAGASDFVSKRMVDRRLLPAIQGLWRKAGTCS
jgi:two-component system OmpR family response regulator